MGVQGLWTILEPAARPVKLETLAKKRLAIDASIWIYQFLKAVRDKEGQAFRNSHVVGFFRRICKLLFFGIKPVFVFDGGAPALKRQTLANRVRRREGRKEDATRTAGKMLALQMRRRAIQETEKEKFEDVEGDQLGDDVVYFGEIDMKPEERKRKFRKTDQYHLPNLEFPLEKMAAPTDTRILTEAELEQYAKDYHMLDDLSHYDFSALDFDSDYFRSLPLAEQYSILNAARLRSRWRMGYSKEQLDDMFPDRLAFSRFQIERLKERNEYTQRLMNLNGMNDVGPQRIAGEKGREYYLVRNEGAEGGWVLGLADTEGVKEKPVLLDVDPAKERDEDEDADFEDVPLEASQPEIPEILETIGKTLRNTPGKQTKLPFKPLPKPTERLFVSDEEDDEMEEINLDLNSDVDGELQTAIALSMHPSQSQRSSQEEFEVIGHDLNDDASNYSDVELQKAISMSLADHTDFEEDGMELDDSPKISSARSPRTARDKGKGVATSFTPEPTPSETGNEIQRAIELSKVDFRNGHRQNGVGTSKDFAPTDAAQSKPGPALGRSMFRRKEQPSIVEVEEPVAPKVASKQQPVDIVGDTADDDVLAQKITQASPAPVPTVHDKSTEHSVLLAPWTPRRQVEPTKNSSIQANVDFEMSPSPSPELDRSPPTTSQGNVQPNSVEETQAVPSSQEVDYASDDEDEDLIAQLAEEAEEHARFTSSINPAASKRPEDYSYYSALKEPNMTEEDFEKEMRSLRNQQKRDRRDADEVTQVMITECQQLLRLFGLPYIIAPMEAEAQCAELVKLGLVDGIVTDDSDIFLFGGTRVYKNMFNQAKFVECYLLSDLERDFNLDRRQFINLAHLLGSDYAEGIPHVGPVNALELLSDFSGERGLEEFRDWWLAVQQGRAGKDPGESEFRRKFRKNSTKIFLPSDFPNRIIDQAYLHPEVDHDPQPFVWGVPDLDALRSFLMSQIGWSKERTDEILVPVIKDMNRRQIEGAQSNLTDYFEGNVGSGTYAPRRKVTHRSSRMTKAMANLQRRRDSDDDVQVIEPIPIKSKRKRPAPEVVKVESDDEISAVLSEQSYDETETESDEQREETQRGSAANATKRGGSRRAPSKVNKVRPRKKVKA